MRGHDAELERGGGHVEICVALREDSPRRRGARLNADDLAHEADGGGEVGVNVSLVAVAQQRAHLV